jgi:hypothetical protein
VSEAEDPGRVAREREGAVTVEDVRALMGPSTPHFALQLRARLRALVADLPDEHPARVEAEREIARLEALAYAGEVRGGPGEDGERPLPSLRKGPGAGAPARRLLRS